MRKEHKGICHRFHRLHRKINRKGRKVMRKEHKENLYHIALITQKEILDFE